jgi:rhamnosyltransferase
MPSNNYISVFIPTFNGEKYIGESIESILKQELPENHQLELIIIDSGSTDGTLDIIQRHKEHIVFKTIPNKEFSHGRTRAQAARMAKGEFILFITQDATPAHTRWLLSMIEPFYLSPLVGCVFGAQVPRSDAAPTIKREVATAFGALGARDAIIIHRHTSLVDHVPTNGPNTFFSDANSAVRRGLLVGEVPFRDVNYAEDQALAEDMQNKGYLKAYAPQGEVWHSNEYTARGYFYRKFDEYIGLQESLGRTLPRSRKSLLLGWIRPTFYDYRFIMRDASYSPKAKLKGLAEAPLYNIAAKAGLYYASKYLKDPVARKKISYEHKWRS